MKKRPGLRWKEKNPRRRSRLLHGNQEEIVMATYKRNKIVCLFLFLLLSTLLSGAKSSGEFIEVNVEIENFTWGEISEITLSITKGTYESFQSNIEQLQ